MLFFFFPARVTLIYMDMGEKYYIEEMWWQESFFYAAAPSSAGDNGPGAGASSA
jgi:hypothetical protein